MKDLRNHINKAASQHTELVDNDALWLGIEQKMKPKKKERRFLPFIFWGLSFLFVLAIFGIYSYSNNQKNEPVNIETLTTNSINIDLTNQVNTPIQNSNKSSTQTNANIISNESIPIKFKASEQSENKGTKTSTFTTPAEPSQTKEFEIYSQNNQINSSDIIDVERDQIESKKAIQNEQIKITREDKVIDICKISTLYNLATYERPKIILEPAIAPSIPMLSRDDKRFSLFKSFTFYTQYGIGSKSIVHADSEYEILRNESETMLEQVRLGFESDLISFLDFTLYGGVSYVSINDRLSFEESYYEDREITYLKAINVLPDGTEIEIFETDELPHLITNQAERLNSHRLISMPLGLKFDKDFSKLNISIAFGLDLNYALSGTHSILSTDGELTKVSVGGKWLSPSLHTGISVEYPILDNWFLHSRISYRNTEIENFSVESDVQESYSIYGIDVGARFKF